MKKWKILAETGKTPFLDAYGIGIVYPKVLYLQNMKYEIKICDEEFLVNRAQEFSDLCVKAFEEHKDRDIQMPPCSMTPSKWLECIKGCICFILKTTIQL